MLATQGTKITMQCSLMLSISHSSAPIFTSKVLISNMSQACADVQRQTVPTVVKMD